MPTTAADLARLERSLAEAQRRSHAAMDRRRALPPGSSRARVTTANANWARAAEHRDRCAERLDAARAELAAASPAPAPAPAARTYRAGETIALGRATYTIERVASYGLELRGARGGSSALVQCAKQPALWAHVQSTRSTDYRQTADSFELW